MTYEIVHTVVAKDAEKEKQAAAQTVYEELLKYSGGDSEKKYV